MRDNDLPDHLLYPCPFLYGIRSPDGTPWLDIYCVDPDRDKLKHGRVAALNRDNPDGSGRYETVPLYTLDQVETMLASQKDEILTRQRRHVIFTRESAPASHASSELAKAVSDNCAFTLQLASPGAGEHQK